MKHFAVLILCAACFPLASARAGAQDIGVFDAMTDIPAEVDAAAVFYDPAESILLSPVGRSMRSLLAFGGVFTQTENAWGALADAFDAPVDETIRSLLSDQVAVVWDGLESQAPDMAGVTDSFDTRWTLICKVKPQYLEQIRRSLRPVKRDIVHARAVYSIEQGRYRIALIDAETRGTNATVLLAPRSGAELLNAVLGHAVAGRVPESGSITAGHEPMLAELSAYHDSIDDGSWSFVLMSRLGIFNSLLSIPPQDAGTQNHTLAAIVKLNPGDLRCSFATDLPLAQDTPDAPIELFDAVAADSVFTLAASRAPRLQLTEDSFSINMSFSTGEQDRADSDPIFDAPALISLSPGDASNMTLALCLSNPKREDAETSRLSDDAVRAMISSFDQSQAPDFAGRFPGVRREISLRIPAGEDANPDDWPGLTPNLAWQVTPTRSHDVVVAALGPTGANIAQHIQNLSEAARTLDAFDTQNRSGVLLRLSMRPAETLRLVNDPDIMNIALAKIINDFDIGIRRGVDASMRGRIEIRFTESVSKPKLGNGAP